MLYKHHSRGFHTLPRGANSKKSIEEDNMIISKSSQKNRTVVFVTFESEFAPVGGLAAVMRILPRRMAQATGGDCFTLTPLFKHITRCNDRRWASLEPTGHVFNVRFGDVEHTVTLRRHMDAHGFTTYLLDSELFFNAPCDCGNPPAPEAPCNPYRDPAHPEQLLQDALFFAAAVPQALVALGKTANLILSLQDWQGALAAFTVKRTPALTSVACVLTVHNPYDKPLSTADAAQIGGQALPGPTVLTKMLPFVDGPVCTVSENFAEELTTEVLHTDVYAPHLQKFFRRKGVRGINNGLFAALDFPEAALSAAREGDFGPLLAVKARRRAALVRVLQSYRPPEAWGTLADLDAFDGPIFLLFGRDDPRQKGYDVAAAAIRQLPPGQAKYIFTPIPGDEGLAGLHFLKALAQERPGEVKIFPFRVARGYVELQRGASYLVMASLYEPFGAATEGYAVGTPVVARATGGLVQQVAPYPSACLNAAVRRRAACFHDPQACPTGFLFREPDLPRETLIAGWRRIVACDYFPGGDRVTDRQGSALFDALVLEAARAFQDAITLYMNNPPEYARMIAGGFEMLRAFSWERAVREYRQVYGAVSR